MIALVLLALAFFGLVSYSVYKSETNETFKIIVFPLLILVGIAMGGYYLNQLGKPLDQLPRGEWHYIHHESDGEDIELWLRNKDGSRLYTFPYTKERNDALEKAQEDKNQGHSVTGEFQTEQDGNNDQNSEGELLIKRDKRIIPK